MHEDAIEYLDKSLEINPKHEGALYYKAKALFETERYDEALTFIDKVLETDPDNQQAAEHKKIILNEKGRLSLELEKPEEALVWFDKALEIDPEHITSLKTKALALYEKGRLSLELEKPEEALVWFDKALEIDPNAVYTLSGKGWALSELGNHDEALVWFDKALEIDPNAVYVLSNKGVTLYRLVQYDEAISYYDKALEIDPNYELAIKNKELAKKDKEFLKNDEVLTPETEEIDYDSIRPFFLLAISGGVYYMFYFVRKRRQKYIRKTRQIINEPSFSVLKIRWGGLNITYLVIFDKERILFIRPDKISTDRLDWSLDEILDMDKQNFGIPFDEVAKIELKHSTYGVNGIRAGKMIISYKNHQDSFDILPTEAFDHCEKLIKDFLPSKLTSI